MIEFNGRQIHDGKTWPTLYVKTATGSINYWNIWTAGPLVHVEWGQMGTESPQRDSYTAEAKNIGKKNETHPFEQAQKEAQAKFDKQIRLKYVRTVEEARHGLNIKPMRCYVLDEKRAKKVKWPVTVQPKFNGVRCMAYNLPDGTVRLMSRGGKDYTLPHVQEVLRGRIPSGHCLDGELYVHGASLQYQRHLIETYSELSIQVGYTLYDYTTLPPDGTSWQRRAENLASWFIRNQGIRHIFFSPNYAAQDLAHVKYYHDEFVKLGYEGAIIREHTGTYKLAARSTQVLKYKVFQDAEFEVVGWSVGKDGVILYQCVQEDGKQFEVRPMGTDAERAELLKTASSAVGQKLTVKFQERSDDNIPIFPVGVAFRPEKDMD